MCALDTENILESIVVKMLGENKEKTIYGTHIHSLEKIELVHSGHDYFNRLQHIISNARSELHLQTYLFKNDATGIKVANTLREAATRNGINIPFFSPFFSINNLYLSRRLHHKVVVVDRNIAYKYHKTNIHIT